MLGALATLYIDTGLEARPTLAASSERTGVDDPSRSGFNHEGAVLWELMLDPDPESC